MENVNLEELKKKYQDIWQKTMDEKSFLKLVKLKEKQQKIKRLITQKMRREEYKKQKHIEEALITFAKMFFKNYKEEYIQKIITEHSQELIIETKKKTKKGTILTKKIDYTKTLLAFLKEVKAQKRMQIQTQQTQQTQPTQQTQQIQNQNVSVNNMNSVNSVGVR